MAAVSHEMHFPDLKNNAHCVIKDTNVCKITDVKLSRPGKHGHAKKFVTGKCVLTDRKFTEIFTHHSVFKYFTMLSITYTLCAIEDDFLSLMDNEGEIREDIPLPASDSIDAELGVQIQELYDEGEKTVNITVLTVCIGKPDDADYKEGSRITNVLGTDD